MATDISTQPQPSRNMSMGNTFRQEYAPTLTLRYDRHIRQERLSKSQPQIYQYDQDRKERNTIV